VTMNEPVIQTLSKEAASPCIDAAASTGAAEVSGRRGRPSLEEAQRLPERILEAGWEVLAAHGFEHFTYDRVSRHARIGKVTIYNRFPGKADFLAALLKFKVHQRRMSIMAIGEGLPLVESFCKRAVAVVEILISPEGVMMERLVDWCDQEFGNDEVNHRHAMYEESLVHIETELRQAVADKTLVIHDVSLAARFWLEGLIGHVRFLGNVRAFNREETESWARSYSEFFFAALRS